MPGGNARHSEIAMNVGYAIKKEVKTLPTRFRVYNSDLKIFIESENKVVYPDALVICDMPIYWNNREDLIINPLLIVEVVSATTHACDRGENFLLYEQEIS